MTTLNEQMITTEELESVVGGFGLSFAALNPQPIPPGRGNFGVNFGALNPQPIPLRTPGCPGPF
jgi:hypothetical protein